MSTSNFSLTAGTTQDGAPNRDPVMRMGRPGRPIITDRGRFGSSVEAAAVHGLSPSHCHARAKRQIDGWHFEDEPLRFRRKWAIAVITPAGSFATVSAAAKCHGICCATVEARIRRSEEGWRYATPGSGGRPTPDSAALRGTPASDRLAQQNSVAPQI